MHPASFMTAAQARTKAFELLASGADGANSPEYVAQVRGMLGLVHRNLCLEYAAILPRAVWSQTIVPGRRCYPIPCAPEGVKSVLASQSGAPYRLGYGQALEEAMSTIQGIPMSYAIRPQRGVAVATVTAGGAGYTQGANVLFSAPPAGGTAAKGLADVVGGAVQGITITDPGSGYLAAPTATVEGGDGAVLIASLGMVDQIDIVPAPALPGTLTVEFVSTPGPTLDDTDVLAIDPTAVIAVTAANVAKATGHALTEGLVVEAGKAVAMLATRMPLRASGGSFSMAGGRRN